LYSGMSVSHSVSHFKSLRGKLDFFLSFFLLFDFGTFALSD
jgi:hypothetical protein